MQPFAPAPGYIWTGSVFARLDPVPGDPHNVLTVSQAAHVWGAPDPSQYSPVADQPIPSPAPTPVFGMDENGNIGPVTDPRYLYSVDQAAAGAQMLHDQLYASGSNPYGPAAPSASVNPVATVAPAPVFTANTPEPGYAPAPDTSGYMSQDAAAYYSRYPDLARAYQASTLGLNPTQWAQTHFERYGRAEGRVWGVQAGEAPPDYLFPTGSANNAGGSTPVFPAPAPGPAAAPAPAPAPTGTPPRGAAVTYLFSAGIEFADAASYAYFLRYPDVAAAYRANSYGMTPDAFAAAHYARFGVPERRIWSATPPATGSQAVAAGGGLSPLVLAVAAAYFFGM